MINEQDIPVDSDPARELSEREIIAILDSYQEASISTRNSQLSKERGKALEFYNMEPYGNETRTGSKVVTSEVFDTVETIATRLVKVFTSTDKAVEFVPEGPEDVEGADQKTKYANYIFYRENNGFNVLYEAIKDGLIMKNGIIKVYPEVNKSVKFSSFQGLTEMQAAMLADEEGVEFVGANWEVQEDGTPLFDLEIKHVSDDIKIRVEAVAPEEFSVVGWHKSVLLEDCDFIQHRTRVSVTRLREMGLVGNDEDVTDLGGAGFDEDDSSEEDLARDEEIDEQRVFRDNNPLQKEMWRVVVKDIIARVDEDGDGIAERRRFIRIGNTIRYDEPIDYCPYGVFAPIIMPHRFIGKSSYDLMGQWQHVQSTLLRQTLNNIYLNNHQRPIIKTSGGRPRVDMTSLLTAGPGQPIYEEEAGALRYEPPPQIVSDITGVAEFVKQQGETRTGITRISQGINPDAITKTAAGAAILTENANEREELMARVCAETCLKPVFKAISHLIKRYQNKKKMIRIYNKFVEMDPAMWSDAYDMSINVGLGSGTARQTTENIERLMAVQEKMVAAGALGTIIQPANLYASAARHAETIGFKDASAFFTDPSTVEPPPPQPSIEEKQLETLKEIEQMKALLAKYKIDTESKDAAEKNQNDLMKAAIDARNAESLKKLDVELKTAEIQADLVKTDRKNVIDTEIAVMDAIARLDEEDMKERAALLLEEKRERNALDLEEKKTQREDKKVVSIKQAAKEKAEKKKSAAKEAARMKLKDTPDGGVEGEHKGRKVMIKPVGDGFEVEMMAAAEAKEAKPNE